MSLVCARASIKSQSSLQIKIRGNTFLRKSAKMSGNCDNLVKALQRQSSSLERRSLLGLLTLSGFAFQQQTISQSNAATIASDLCDNDCAPSVDSIETITTPSGLQYKDIVVGKGPSPKIGFQVVCNYVAMTPEGKVFDSSIEKGFPYDIRVGAEAVVKGLDEGLLSMKTGGIRRLYIPGNLSFPNGLKSGPGRPRILPNSPVVFDVQLLYIPGLDYDEEE